MTTPNVMPKRIVTDTVSVIVRENPEWATVFVDDGDVPMFITEKVRVVGVERPTETAKAAARKHERYIAECDARDGVTPSITRERAYAAARRAAGIR